MNNFSDIDVLRDQYPTPEVLKHFLTKFDDNQKQGFIRLWISEGIPYHFKDNPIQYELIRENFAKKLGVHPKEITLIGSARVGYSLVAMPKYGDDFTQKSDFDFSVISADLFAQCAEAFNCWKNNFEGGLILPRTEAQKKYWPENKIAIPKNILRGFIDPYKIPTLQKYQPAGKILDSCHRIEKIFNLRKVGVRVYKNWESFCKQTLLNLNYLITSF